MFVISNCNPWNRYEVTKTFTDTNQCSTYIFVPVGSSYGSFMAAINISRSGTTVTATVTFDYTGFNDGVHTGGIYGYIYGFRKNN